MPSPQHVQDALLALTFFFLLASFSRKFFFVCAYFLIMLNRPGLYYPLLGQIRFELIIAIWAVILLSMGWGAISAISGDKIVQDMWAFLLIIMVSMVQAFSFTVAWNWVYTVVLPNTLITLLVLMFCNRRKELVLFLWVFIIATIGLGYEAVYNYVVGDVVDMGGTGIGGFQFATAKTGRAGNHNAVANFFLTVMPFLWYMGLSSKKNAVKLTGLFLLAFSLTGVFISGSRGGMVGLVVMMIVTAMLSRKKIFFAVGGVLLLAVSIPFMGDAYTNRMASILNGPSSDGSASSRILGLTHGIDMMIKRPILGVGPGCYPVARQAWFGMRLWAHNHYGQLAGELGVIGVVSWYILVRDYMKRSLKFIKAVDTAPWVKNIASAVFVLGVVRLVLGMFDHSTYRFVWYISAVIVINLKALDN